MVVQHNLTAMNANRYLGINNTKLSKSLEKLSSGYAIRSQVCSRVLRTLRTLSR